MSPRVVACIRNAVFGIEPYKSAEADGRVVTALIEAEYRVATLW